MYQKLGNLRFDNVHVSVSIISHKSMILLKLSKFNYWTDFKNWFKMASKINNLSKLKKIATAHLFFIYWAKGLCGYSWESAPTNTMSTNWLYKLKIVHFIHICVILKQIKTEYSFSLYSFIKPGLVFLFLFLMAKFINCMTWHSLSLQDTSGSQKKSICHSPFEEGLQPQHKY